MKIRWLSSSDTGAPEEVGVKHSRWWRGLRLVTSMLIGGLWGWALGRQWPYLTAYPWQPQPTRLTLAFLLLLTQMLILGTAWWRLLIGVAAVLPWRRAAGMWLQAQIARYLPGGMWDIAARAVLGRAWAIQLRQVSAAAVLEAALQVTTSATVLFLFLAFDPTSRWQGYLLPLGIGVCALWTILFTPLFPRAVNFALERIGRPRVPFTLAPKSMALAGALYLAAHAAQGLAFALFVQGLTPIRWNHVPLLAAAYVGAWLIGYLAVFAPTGVGVREGIVVLLLAGPLPVPLLMAAALGFRVWLILRDGVSALIGLALSRQGR